MLEPAGARDVRPPAEIHERPVGVHRDDLAVPQLGDPFQLEWVVGEAAVGFLPAHFLPDEAVILRGHLGHLLFDGGQVFGRERTLDGEIVVKAVLDRRAEADPCLGEELPDRRGKDMGGGVAEHLQRLGIPLGENRHPGIVLDGPVEVEDLPVDLGGNGGPGEAGTDALCQRPAGDAAGGFAHAAVGEREPHSAHGSPSVITG